MLVFVGGFLGAGKTTLILAAARELERRGFRTAAILNDQGDSLVDRQLARSQGVAAGEVTGGCFCCRFSELMRTVDELRNHQPQVIFAEPVGSCTDISATILQPIRSAFPGDYQLAPFTVLVDPARAQALLTTDADPNLTFLFRKQLEEADMVCFTKSDLYPDAPELPGITTRRVSAKTGQGVAAWLDEMLSGELVAGGRVLEIDYEEYARAEASLAWLNLEATLELEIPQSPAMILGPFLDRLDKQLTAAGIPIVHLKATDDTSKGFLKAAVCASIARKPSCCRCARGCTLYCRSGNRTPRRRRHPSANLVFPTRSPAARAQNRETVVAWGQAGFWRGPSAFDYI